MFNHIGAKIKGFAKFIFWLMAIFGLIGGVVVIVAGCMNADSAVEILLFVLAGIAVIICSFLFAWLQIFVLYGYGELIDSNQKILELLEEQKSYKQSAKSK